MEPCPALALTTCDDDQYACRLLEALAAYVLKEVAIEAILAVVRRVARRQVGWLSWPVAEKVMRRAVAKRGAEEMAMPLTERELEVLRPMARGMDNSQVAKALVITRHTVKFHSRNIYSRLGVRSRTEAILPALRRGLAETQSGHLHGEKRQRRPLTAWIWPSAWVAVSSALRPEVSLRECSLLEGATTPSCWHRH